MTLSPEERERIYKEEKARKEAQDRLKHEEATVKKEADKKNARRVGIGCLALVGLFFILGLLGSMNSERQKSGTGAGVVRNPAALMGKQVECVGGKLDPICVGRPIDAVYSKYGPYASHMTLVPGRDDGSPISGITGWYIGGLTCRFYFEMEKSAQCPYGGPQCQIIKVIACE